MILYLLNQSPLDNQSLASCLRLVTSEDALLLIEDAVIAATLPIDKLHSAMPAPGIQIWPCPVYALTEDLASRGLGASCQANIQQIDYPGFVDLSVQYPKIISWF